jgi:hypothetical protein
MSIIMFQKCHRSAVSLLTNSLLASFVGFTTIGCTKAVSSSPPPLSNATTSITRKQAIAIINKLPEIAAWHAYVKAATAGAINTTLSVNPETPITYAGRKYWSVSFYENQPTHNSRWQTFLVRLDRQEILVDDLEGKYRSLATWRRDDKPMERVNPSKPIVSP